MRPGIERRSIERRSAEAPRVPLDLWIRLSHEDYEEPFDADAVDLSAGGLAMRADYLPEIGDRLRCRFDCPPAGGEIELDGEVVWAHDAGERSGEFGLRFGDLDVEAETSLRQLVEHLGGTPAHGMARLHLDGVATPLDAQITERDHAWLVAEQELPFLRIGMGVVLEGSGGPPRGRLASVDLRVEDGTPRLVLGVELETEAAASARDVETLDEEPAAALVAATAATTDTVDDVDAGPIVGADATVQDVQLPAGLEREAAASFDADPIEREAVQIFRVQREEDDPRDDLEEAAPEAGLAGVVQRLRPALAKAREAVAKASEKAKPAFAAFVVKLATFFAWLGTKAGPGARAAGAKIAAVSVSLHAKVGAKLGKRAKRRTTAAPPKRVAQSPRLRRQRAEAEAAERPSPKKARRIAILSILAFAGVGSAVYALSGSEAAPSGGPDHPTIPAPPPDMDDDDEDGDTPPSTPPPQPPAPDPENGDTPDTDPPPANALPASAATQAGMPAPQAEAGRLGEPTYPSLRDATERREAPVTEGSSFGAAEVPNGRNATIRMSTPVTTLRAQRTDNGFTVTVPGALALDRAGPIAAANPHVERAMILNRGDHAVLTVTFVAGRSPAYRVTARGNAIEVTIGR